MQLLFQSVFLLLLKLFWQNLKRLWENSKSKLSFLQVNLNFFTEHLVAFYSFWKFKLFLRYDQSKSSSIIGSLMGRKNLNSKKTISFKIYLLLHFQAIFFKLKSGNLDSNKFMGAMLHLRKPLTGTVKCPKLTSYLDLKLQDCWTNFIILLRILYGE